MPFFHFFAGLRITIFVDIEVNKKNYIRKVKSIRCVAEYVRVRYKMTNDMLLVTWMARFQ